MSSYSIKSIIICMILLVAGSQSQAKSFIHRFDCEKLFHTGTAQQMEAFCQNLEGTLEKKRQQNDKIVVAEMSAILVLLQFS